MFSVTVEITGARSRTKRERRVPAVEVKSIGAMKDSATVSIGWKTVLMDGWMDGGREGGMEGGREVGGIEGWIKIWMKGWRNGWMNKWLDGWIYSSIYDSMDPFREDLDAVQEHSSSRTNT